MFQRVHVAVKNNNSYEALSIGLSWCFIYFVRGFICITTYVLTFIICHNLALFEFKLSSFVKSKVHSEGLRLCGFNLILENIKW